MNIKAINIYAFYLLTLFAPAYSLAGGIPILAIMNCVEARDIKDPQSYVDQTLIEFKESEKFAGVLIENWTNVNVKSIFIKEAQNFFKNSRSFENRNYACIKNTTLRYETKSSDGSQACMVQRGVMASCEK
ncbi:MAG TPA: hypothetical protein PLJ21_11065 [Pseudobdellovibrionaceae bacterium]|nr:hypothetical protein [Pseudobdellovibrionaceae bacterium]